MNQRTKDAISQLIEAAREVQVESGGPDPDYRKAAEEELATAQSNLEAAIEAEFAAPLAALTALTSNPCLDLGDLVYQVREREGLGWDGPAVTAWSNAVGAAKDVLTKARG